MSAGTTPYPRFHLALPVTDLDDTRRFYEQVLGCSPGRESSRWVDLDFFGHQLVLHRVDADAHSGAATNPVDGEQVPAGHFGPVLDYDALDRLIARLEAHGIDYLIRPTTRFAGRRGEQRTLFIRDPSGNALEFKAFRDPEMLFATDPEAYS